jgi:hypothetical protein
MIRSMSRGRFRPLQRDRPADGGPIPELAGTAIIPGEMTGHRCVVLIKLGRSRSHMLRSIKRLFQDKRLWLLVPMLL